MVHETEERIRTEHFKMKERMMRTIINRRDALKKMGLGLAALGSFRLTGARAASTQKRPNIIFMVADNLGKEALGMYGGGTAEAKGKRYVMKTPRLEEMAAGGVLFDNCLIATPLCSPARCGWNTGRHPFRVGNNSQPKPDDPESGLPLGEITIAEVLKKAGYDTALCGKWNLGYAEKFNPTLRGFDSYYGSSGKRHFYRNRTPINDEGYFDKLFTDEAIAYLRGRRGNPKPFYLNLTFYAPHGPYQPPPGYEDSPDRLVDYAHMIEYLDACVGRVADEVERLGMAENTLLVFLSDQGGSTFNGFGRTLSEGSLRVACAARWKGAIPEGKRVRSPWVHLDLFAVFAHLAGGEVPRDRPMDARNVWSLFLGKESKRERTFYWSFKDEDAIRMGDWKLRLKGGKVQYLVDLAKDPDEKNDLSGRFPDKVRRMRKQHANWKTECEEERSKRTGGAHK